MKLFPKYVLITIGLALFIPSWISLPAAFCATTEKVVVQNGPLEHVFVSSDPVKTWYGRNYNREWYRRSKAESGWERLFPTENKLAETISLPLHDSTVVQLSKNNISPLFPDPAVLGKIWLIAPEDGFFFSLDRGGSWTEVSSEEFIRYEHLYINTLNPDQLVAKVQFPNPNGSELVESLDGGASWKKVTIKSGYQLRDVVTAMKDGQWIVSAMIGRAQIGDSGGDLFQWRVDPGASLNDIEPEHISIPRTIPPLPVPGTTDTITTVYPRNLRVDPTDPGVVLLFVDPRLYVYLDQSISVVNPSYPLITVPGETQWSLAPKPWEIRGETPEDTPDFQGVEWSPVVGPSIGLPDTTGTFIAGTLHGLIRSDDQGRTWRLVSDFRATDFTHHPSDPGMVFALGYKAVQISMDGGRIWRSSSLPEKTSTTQEYRSYSPSFPFADADSWVMNCDGDPWITHDRGTTWTLDSKKPNLGELVMVRDTAHVRLYKGRKLNVSTDSGRNWREHTIPGRSTTMYAYSPDSDWLITTNMEISPDLGLQWHTSRRSSKSTLYSGYWNGPMTGKSTRQMMRDREGRLSRSVMIEQDPDHPADRPPNLGKPYMVKVSSYDVVSRSWQICTFSYQGMLQEYSINPDNTLLFSGHYAKVVRTWESDWKSDSE